MRGMCDTVPRGLVRPTAMLLQALMASGQPLQGPACAWLAAAMQSAEFRGAMHVVGCRMRGCRMR